MTIPLLVWTLQEVQCDYFFSRLGSDLRRVKGCWRQQNLWGANDVHIGRAVYSGSQSKAEEN